MDRIEVRINPVLGSPNVWHQYLVLVRGVGTPSETVVRIAEAGPGTTQSPSFLLRAIEYDASQSPPKPEALPNHRITISEGADLSASWETVLQVTRDVNEARIGYGGPLAPLYDHDGNVVRVPSLFPSAWLHQQVNSNSFVSTVLVALGLEPVNFYSHDDQGNRVVLLTPGNRQVIDGPTVRPNLRPRAGLDRDVEVTPACFLAGTPILMADGQEKPIEDIRPGDLVMSFDPSADQGRGALVPKPVSRTFQNITRSIIDLRGLHMTPGHVCLTDDGRFETIAEILLRDGILVEADGTPIRARTGAKIGSMEDIPVLIAYPDEKTGKEIFVRARAGIPCCLVRERDGTKRHVSLAQMLRAYHQTLTPDGLILSPDSSLGEATDWPEDSTPMDEDYRRNWVIQTADGKPYVPEWILEVASEAREEQTVGATLQRIISPPSQRFAPKVVDNPTPPARNRAERRAQKHRGPK